MRRKDALGSVGEVGSVVPPEARRRRLVPAPFRGRRWPVVAVAAGAFGAALWYTAAAAKGAPVAVGAAEGLLPLTAAWFVGDAAAARRRYLAGLADHPLPYFLNGERLVVGVAMDQLKPAALAGGTTAGPGGGLLHLPPMPSWAMITVIAGWIVGWPAIGAWKMATRDA